MTLNTFEKWNKRIATALPEDIVVTSAGVALDAAGTDLKVGGAVSGKMNRCGLSLLVRNDSFVHVLIKLDKFEANGTPFEAQLTYMADENTPVVLPIDLTSSLSPLFTVLLSPGRSATLTYFVRLEDFVRTDVQSGFVANVELSVYQDDNLVVKRMETMTI